MNKNIIYPDAHEKLEVAQVVYLKAADSILYADLDGSTYKNAIKKDELINLFKKGLILVDDGTNFVRPTMLTVSSDYAAVSYVSVTTSESGSAAAVTSFYSEGYSAS